jgi:hypothetical protein
MIYRVLAAGLLLLSILSLPWWITIAAALTATIFFHRYYELVGFGLLVDLMYGLPSDGFLSIPFLHTLAALLILGFIEVMKSHIMMRA